MPHLQPGTEACKALSSGVKIHPEGLILGRNVSGPDGLPLPSNWIQCSGKHCKLYREEKSWFIKDLSRNGTLVNGVKIGKDTACPLKDGDLITVSSKSSATVNAVHAMWKFLEDDIATPAATQNPTAGNGQANMPAAKRKSSEPSPGTAKRQKGSDIQTDWVVKNTRLVKQLEAQSEAHWKELAQTKEKAISQEKTLTGEIDKLKTQLKAMEEKVEASREAEKWKDEWNLSETRYITLKEESKAAEARETCLMAERDKLKEELHEVQTKLQETTKQAAEELSEMRERVSNVEMESKGAVASVSDRLVKAQAALSDTKITHEAALEDCKRRAREDHEAIKLVVVQSKEEIQMLKTRIDELEHETQKAAQSKQVLQEELINNMDIFNEIHAAFDRRLKLDTEMADLIRAEELSLKAAELKEEQRRRDFLAEKELQMQKALESREECGRALAEEGTRMARMLACALGESHAALETQADEDGCGSEGIEEMEDGTAMVADGDAAPSRASQQSPVQDQGRMPASSHSFKVTAAMEDNQPEETPTNHLLSLTKFGIDSAGRTENDGPHSTENPARPTGNSRSSACKNRSVLEHIQQEDAAASRISRGSPLHESIPSKSQSVANGIPRFSLPSSPVLGSPAVGSLPEDRQEEDAAEPSELQNLVGSMSPIQNSLGSEKLLNTAAALIKGQTCDESDRL